MKKCLSILLIIPTLIVGASFTDLNAAPGPVETVIQYFEASKSGDVETMKSLIAGPFYKRRIVLLEKNVDYPEFLKKFYDGATMEPLHYDIGDGDMVKTKYPDLYNKYSSDPKASLNDNLNNGNNDVSVVIAKILFRDGSKVKYEYLLKKADSGSWKIYDEILITNS